MHVTYFAADLTDPALERRVRMLHRGGATVDILGFRRSAVPVPTVDGVATVDLGQTFHGKLGDRLIKVLRCSLEARNWRQIVRRSDVLLARNLEMATIADAARVWANARPRLVYECLDIHGSQLGTGVRSKVLRSWERRTLRRSAAVIISSPSHVANYFDHLGVALPEVIMAENKRLLPESAQRPDCVFDERRPPWRIGWFGLLRCVESFQELRGLALRHPGLVDITLRGRPTAEVQSLIDRVLPMPSMRFEGAYTQADLATMYGACDFTWAIEFAGQSVENAKWALGNRLYEGSFYNVPTMALADTAMGAWLKSRRTGVLMADPSAELDSFFRGLTAAQYHALQRSTSDIPTSDLVWTTDDCRRFNARIAAHKMSAIHQVEAIA